MAVEIKELVIRAIAQEREVRRFNYKPEKQEEQTTEIKEVDSNLTAEQLELIVDVCVREVLKIMERKQMR